MNYGSDSLSVAEAAAFLGVPEAQLVRWAQQGVGPKFEGHALRPDRMQYGYADLIDWKADAQRRTGPTIMDVFDTVLGEYCDMHGIRRPETKPNGTVQ